MMTFYLGKEIVAYEKKFKAIKEHYKLDMETGSNSETFRHIIDLLYIALKKNNKKVKD